MEVRVHDHLRQSDIILPDIDPGATTVCDVLERLRNPPHGAQLWMDDSEGLLVHLGRELTPETVLASLLPPGGPGATSPLQLYLFLAPRTAQLQINKSPVVRSSELRLLPHAPQSQSQPDDLLSLFLRLSGNPSSYEASAESGGGPGQGSGGQRVMNSAEFCEHLSEAHADSLGIIVSLGFSQCRAFNALVINRLNAEAAIEWLLQNQADLSDQLLPPEQLAGVAGNMGIELVEPVPQPILDAIAAQQCTYTATGREFCFQRWYQCLTCGLSGSAGVCVTCAERCHSGHQLSPQVRATGFYCDCGSGAYCISLAPIPSSPVIQSGPSTSSDPL